MFKRLFRISGLVLGVLFATGVLLRTSMLTAEQSQRRDRSPRETWLLDSTRDVCQNDDNVCPTGCTPQDDNDCVDFAFDEIGPILTRGGNLAYYYLWRYREEVYGQGRGHYINQCQDGGVHQGPTILSCSAPVTLPVAITELPAGLTTPPTDTIDAHSFTHDGDEIVIKDSKYWRRGHGQGAWTEGDLTELWQTLPGGTLAINASIVPTSGIDAFAVEPASCGGYGVTQGDRGWWVCSYNGYVWDTQPLTEAWASDIHPPYSGIDAMEYVYVPPDQDCDGDGIIKVYYRDDRMWTQCGPPDLDMQVESLRERWDGEKLLVTPPITDGIDAYGVDPSQPDNLFHWTSSGSRYWSADNEAWHFKSFESGPDAWLLRDARTFENKARDGKYYLFYDAMTPDEDAQRHQWHSAVAVSESPLGPWRKLGFVSFLGAPRWWESGDEFGQGSSISASVFYYQGRYYMFYIAFNSAVEDATWAVPGWWDDVHNQDPDHPATYHLGLASSDSLYGPWQRESVEGVNNESQHAPYDGVDCSAEGCVISQATGGSFGDIYASNKGTLIPKDHPGNPTCDCRSGPCTGTDNTARLPCAHLFLYTACATPDAFADGHCRDRNCWGHGMIYTLDDLLGPWYRAEFSGTMYLTRTGDLVVGPRSDVNDYGSENNDLFYEESSQTWFLFADSKYYPGGGGSCGATLAGGKGQAVFWTQDLFDWPESNYYLFNAPLTSGMVCNPQDNSLRAFLRENQDPAQLDQHRGNDGPPSVLYKPDENRLYVYYDGNDFSTTHEDLFVGTLHEDTEVTANHMFRDIWVATLELPLSQKVAGMRVTQDGQDIPIGHVYDFGPVEVGSSRTVTFSVENERDEALTLSSIEVSSDQFSLDIPGPFPLPVEAHSALAFRITFAPTEAGRQTATVSIQINGSARYVYAFTVAGGQERLYLPLVLRECSNR
ncbi:MAG: choice-of-anchor D domain-containing protein [Anaerolineae bacterium]